MGKARKPRPARAAGKAASERPASAEAASARPASAEAAAAGAAPAGTAPARAGSRTGQPEYPGQGLGRPETGPGSVSRIGRKLAALFIDWLLCMVIAFALTRSQAWTIVVFAAEDYVLTALTGLTIGKRLLGIRVTRTDGGPVGPGWALVRTLLLLAAVPPLLQDRDLRGLHDRAANTIVVRI